MTFQDVGKSYEEKRQFRYGLQDYMPKFFAFERLKDKLVLEIGSGSGIDSAEMIRNGAQVVSLDFSSLACKSTQSLLKEARLDGNVIMADANHLPFRELAFGAVYSYGVIHHIPNVKRVLEEIKRCLQDDGVFMGMVYNRNSLLYAYSLLFLHGVEGRLLKVGLTEQELASRYSERIEGNPYTDCYARTELQDLLKQYFLNVEIKVCYNVIDTPLQRKVKFQLEDGSEELGWHLAFRAAK